MKRLVWLAAVPLMLSACSDKRDTGVVEPAGSIPLVAAFSTGGSTAGATGASLTTDKADYAPGETVIITGAGWEAGETVVLTLTEDPVTDGTHTYTTVADSAGGFINTDFSPGTQHLGVTFTLVAMGQASGMTATTVFTDGTLNSASIELRDPTCTSAVSLPYGVAAGTVVCANLTLTITGGGNTNYWVLWTPPSGSPVEYARSTSGSPGLDETFTATVAGVHTVTVCAADPNPGCPGPQARDIESFTVIAATNMPPVVGAGGPYSGDEGSGIALTGASASDADGDPLTYAWSVNSALCSFSDASILNPTITCSDNGSFTATLAVSDGKVANPVASNAAINVANVAPTATFNAPAWVNEGSVINLSLTGASDPSSVDVAAGFDYAFDCGSGYGSWSSTSTATCPTTDDETRTVKGKIRDKDLDYTEYTASVDVLNVPPTIASLNVSIDPYAVNTAVPFSGAFTDPSPVDTHTIGVACGGTVSASTGTVDATTRTFSGSCTYTGAGLYYITVTITDDDGGTASRTSSLVVVYDPSAGFVTGGGWILSAEGAYKLDLALSGKATFGFVSKYLKGATTPTGNTEFQFQAGGLNFHSSNYEWLVVNQNGTNAQFKGTGDLNGVPGHGFMLWAGDGSPDTFRIQITDPSGAVVYDNGFSQALGSGSIVIHTGGKK